ncbi:MAG: hypothetical protein P4M09_00770 [Devosia sp.]|nr:hypothetical protein [Devosia sp.]
MTMTCLSPILHSTNRAEQLNKGCFCITLDREALFSALEREAGDPEFRATYLPSREHLFSNVPAFLPSAALAEMQRLVRAIEAAARLPSYQAEVLARSPESARLDHGPLGAFMGYDFHFDTDGPKLIEVNTNAGGAFLNALLLRAQRACCAEVERGIEAGLPDAFEPMVLAMFQDEWRQQRGDLPLRRVAIVDDKPQEQYLYPEFLLARQMLRKHGIDAVIIDASELRHEAGQLLANGEPVDLVYNRLVDFALARPEHSALKAAYESGAVVVTPNPHTHALFSDKRNLAFLSDPATLTAWGLDAESGAALAGVPRTVLVTADNADQLWQLRKQWFFKPASGHGGKAVYRGDKLTRSVWVDIVAGDYVAQAFAAPGARVIRQDGVEMSCKMDVRLYTYAGKTLLTAARLYQGQTTNFRTAGGGFAPIYVV